MESQKSELDSGSFRQILQSFEMRDNRIALAEAEIKRLTDSCLRLREDLLPIFRMVKESKVSLHWACTLFCC